MSIVRLPSSLSACMVMHSCRWPCWLCSPPPCLAAATQTPAVAWCSHVPLQWRQVALELRTGRPAAACAMRYFKVPPTHRARPSCCTTQALVTQGRRTLWLAGMLAHPAASRCGHMPWPEAVGTAADLDSLGPRAPPRHVSGSPALWQPLLNKTHTSSSTYFRAQPCAGPGRPAPAHAACPAARAQLRRLREPAVRRAGAGPAGAAGRSVQDGVDGPGERDAAGGPPAARQQLEGASCCAASLLPGSLPRLTPVLRVPSAGWSVGLARCTQTWECWGLRQGSVGACQASELPDSHFPGWLHPLSRLPACRCWVQAAAAWG